MARYNEEMSLNPPEPEEKEEEPEEQMDDRVAKVAETERVAQERILRYGTFPSVM